MESSFRASSTCFAVGADVADATAIFILSKSCRSVSEDEEEEALKVVTSRRQRFEALFCACSWLRPPPRRMHDDDDDDDDDSALAAQDETDILVRREVVCKVKFFPQKI
jgi:hypothetical protein